MSGSEDQIVLVVVADPVARARVTQLLRTRGLEPAVTSTAEQAVDTLATANFRFTLVDLSVKGPQDTNRADGFDFSAHLKLRPGDSDSVIDPPGAGDRLFAATSPPAISGIVPSPRHESLDKAMDEVIARRASFAPQPAHDNPSAARTLREIALWRSPKMIEISKLLVEAAGVAVTVLITGETGTGKELVARAIHALSSRRQGPFVKVNCAAVPRELLESELFGHERGAFTGADRLNIGKFEAAHGGTILLDEIGDLHPALQAKLLHVLQDGAFSRVGGRTPIVVDVRVVAATNQDLENAVHAGRFREDLYYRLNVIQVVVPPLRDRVEDISGLTNYFVERFSRLYHRAPFSIAPSAMDRLLRYHYPGNVRELENVIKRMIVLGDPLLTRTPLSPRRVAATPDESPTSASANICLREISRNASRLAQREAIARVLDHTGWNRVRAARALRISYRALLYKMKWVGLQGERPNTGTTNRVITDSAGGNA